MHCSVMGREALEAAMIDHYKRLGRGVPCHLLSQGVMICHCYSVTKDTIREAVLQNNLETVEDVTNYTKAGGGCGDCHHDIEHIIEECRQARAGKAIGNLVQFEAAKGVEPVADRELVKKIQELLDNDISVALRNDGGDIELVRYSEGKVFVRLTGNCAACRAADVTLKDYVEKELRQHVRDDLTVVEVTS
jgi:NifU-like protein